MGVHLWEWKFIPSHSLHSRISFLARNLTTPLPWSRAQGLRLQHKRHHGLIMHVNTLIILFEVHQNTLKMIHMPTNRNDCIIVLESLCHFQKLNIDSYLASRLHMGWGWKIKLIPFLRRAKCYSFKKKYCRSQKAFLCSRSFSSISFKSSYAMSFLYWASCFMFIFLKQLC
jgi:hypothetical protein